LAPLVQLTFLFRITGNFGWPLAEFGWVAKGGDYAQLDFPGIVRGPPQGVFGDLREPPVALFWPRSYFGKFGPQNTDRFRPCRNLGLLASGISLVPNLAWPPGKVPGPRFPQGPIRVGAGCYCLPGGFKGKKARGAGGPRGSGAISPRGENRGNFVGFGEAREFTGFLNLGRRKFRGGTSL